MVKKKIPEKINKTVRGYAIRLSKQEKLPISKVIVFGSHARGKTRKWSDIDVCVVSPKFKDSIQALNYLLQIRNDKEVKSGLEPIGFSMNDFKKSSPLINEIRKTGIRVF